MQSMRATFLFALTFVLRGLADGVGAVEGWRNVLLGLAIFAAFAILSYWIGARRAKHVWYHPMISGLVAFATINVLNPLLPWSWGKIKVVILVAALAVISAAAGYLISSSREAVA